MELEFFLRVRFQGLGRLRARSGVQLRIWKGQRARQSKIREGAKDQAVQCKCEMMDQIGLAGGIACYFDH